MRDAEGRSEGAGLASPCEARRSVSEPRSSPTPSAARGHAPKEASGLLRVYHTDFAHEGVAQKGPENIARIHGAHPSRRAGKEHIAGF